MDSAGVVLRSVPSQICVSPHPPRGTITVIFQACLCINQILTLHFQSNEIRDPRSYFTLLYFLLWRVARPLVVVALLTLSVC